MTEKLFLIFVKKYSVFFIPFIYAENRVKSARPAVSYLKRGFEISWVVRQIRVKMLQLERQTCSTIRIAHELEPASWRTDSRNFIFDPFLWTGENKREKYANYFHLRFEIKTEKGDKRLYKSSDSLHLNFEFTKFPGNIFWKYLEIELVVTHDQ